MSDKDEPWTADEIRRNASNWSLHCDGKLLEYMKNLSETIQERGNRTTINLHHSMLDLDRTNIALENATNQLMALQHKQFVENRVYDDDETIANVDNVPTVDAEQTDEQNITVIEAIRNTIETGMSMMEKYFDKVTYELSDSEDDGENPEKSVIFRPKDRYKHRPLPYLIGSKEWHEKWHIGLVEEESDESEHEMAEDNESMSSSPAVSISSNVPISLSESENPTGAAAIPPRKSDAQDLFQSSSDENVSRLSHEIADSNLTFRRQNHEMPNPKQNEINEINANNSIFRQQKPANVPVIPTLIDSDPPELDDLPAPKAGAHKPPNLFFDDEQDDDFMFEKPASSGQNTKQNANIASGSGGTKTNPINLFADDDDNFDSFLPTTSQMAARSAAPKPEVRNLFDNDDDDDDDDDLFLQASVTQPTKSIPVRSTILSNQPKKDVFNYNIFDDRPPDDDDDNFESTSTIEQSPQSKASTSKQSPDKMETVPKKPSTLFSPTVNLFDDDDEDDDDIFEKLIAPRSKKSSLKSDIETVSTKSIVIEDANVRTPTAQSKPKLNLFDSDQLFDDTPPDDDDDQLFSSMSSKAATQKPKPDSVKSSPKEFYNDFSETITSGSEAAESKPIESPKSVSEIAQTVEKPVCIVTEPKIQSNKSKSESTSTSEKRSEFLKKVDSFGNANVNEPKSESEATVKQRQPKKLNIANIDINVTALLPGAKRIKSVEKPDSKPISDDDDDASGPAMMPSTAAVTSHDNVDSSGRLTNLNHNRAKNPLRRPSTRAGRKQQYQKSIDIESTEQTDAGTDQSENNPRETQASPKKQTVADVVSVAVVPKQVKQSPSKQETIKPSLRKEMFEDDLFDGLTTSKGNQEPKIPTDLEATSSHKEDEVDPVSDEMNKQENPFAFLDDPPDDEEIDDFMIESKQTASTFASATVSVKATPAYIDELPPDLDSADDPVPTYTKGKGTSLLSQTALSLFGDDDDEDDFDNNDMYAAQTATNPPELDLPSDLEKSNDDWSPYPSGYVQHTPPSTIDKQAAISSALSLFDDNDDDDDADIFGDVIKNTSTIVKETLPTSIDNSQSMSDTSNLIADDARLHDIFGKSDLMPSTSDTNEQSQQSTSDAKKSTQSVSKQTSSVLGLFDDGTDDADLFGTSQAKPSESQTDELQSTDVASTSNIKEASPIIQKPKPVVSKASSLFGEDEDDGDDIFKPSPQPIEKRVESEKPKSKPVASKMALFGDDDDDDDDSDLFGRRTSLSDAKPIQPKKVSQKIFSDDSSDDDLFGGGKTAKKIPSKSKGASASSTVPKKVTKEIKASGKLFSDSEDDGDDLFGTKSKPIESSSKKSSSVLSKANKEDAPKAVKKVSSSAVDNDPLGLLK